MQLWNAGGAEPQECRAFEQQGMPSPGSMPSALKVNHSPAPSIPRPPPRQAVQTRPGAQDSGKENTQLSRRAALQKSLLPHQQSPFSDPGADQDVRQPVKQGLSIPIPSPNLDTQADSRMAAFQAFRGQLSLQDLASQGAHRSSSLQSLQSLGDSLPSLGDWATLDAAAKFRDLSRDSVESGFGSTSSSPTGSSPPGPAHSLRVRCRGSTGPSNPSQLQADHDADFSFSLRQPGTGPLHGIAEECAMSEDSSDPDGEVLLRSLQNVSAMSDDQDGASSLLLLHDQGSERAEAIPPRPRSPGIKRTRTFGADAEHECKSPRLGRDI